MMLEMLVTLLWLLIPAEPEPPAIRTIVQDLVFCSSSDGAKRVAEAIASIKSPDDGVLAYTIYLREPNCSVTNVATVDTNRGLWAYSSKEGYVYVFQSMEEIGTSEDDHLPYIVWAPLDLMKPFLACEMFVESDFEGERKIVGCQESL